MKRKTKELLTLISNKKKEIREERINKAIHEHTLKMERLRKQNRTPFDEWWDKQWERYDNKMSKYYMELDKRIDQAINKDVEKIHRQLFGY